MSVDIASRFVLYVWCLTTFAALSTNIKNRSCDLLRIKVIECNIVVPERSEFSVDVSAHHIVARLVRIDSPRLSIHEPATSTLKLSTVDIKTKTEMRRFRCRIEQI